MAASSEAWQNYCFVIHYSGYGIMTQSVDNLDEKTWVDFINNMDIVQAKGLQNSPWVKPLAKLAHDFDMMGELKD